MSETKVVKSHKASGRPEDSINFITYALGAVLSFVGLVFLLLKTNGEKAISIAAVSVFGVFTAIVFTVGALAHILPANGKAKTAVERIDRTFVCVLSAAVFAPVMWIGMQRGAVSDGIWGYALYGVIAVCTLIVIALNAFDVPESKLFSLVLYVAVLWASVARLDRIVELCGMGGFWFLIGGYFAYAAAIVVKAPAIPAWHTLRHIFTLIGAALHYVCIYSFLLI